ncbi:MAG TPA: glycerol-3-phosphate dehydrogenase/oxidase [Mycobacteriales bacterium]
MRPFSLAHRSDDVADASTGVDVLVVGMGATGAGVALDAASRGLSVAVIDKGDLASGTSSKSSKLVHGGLRYLENYEFSLVREGVLERQQLMRLAPHLVRPMDFVYPVWPDTAKRRLLGLGLTTYDVFAGVRNVRRHEKVDAVEAITLAPALARSGLDYAYVYGDCATDDARLVLSVVQTARSFGAVALTYTEATQLLVSHDGAVRGAAVRDAITGQSYEISARHVVNATGIWVDTLLGQAGQKSPLVVPSKGVHLVVDHDRLPLTGASVLLPSRAGDGRSMFAIPWGRQTILGTTDTEYDGPLDQISVDGDDLAYVLRAGNDVFDMNLSEDDVLGAWAGARPLLRGEGDSMSDLSRRHTLIASPGGLVTITGGKLTTYRRMAAEVVDLLVARDGKSAPCRTDDIPLGGTGRSYEAVLADVTAAAEALGLDDEVAVTLTRQQGEEAASVLSIVAGDAATGRALSPSAAHLMAEVVQAARHEGAACLDDVFSRRMRLSLRARDAGLPSAAAAATVIAAETGRDAAWAAGQVPAYLAAVAAERGILGAVLPVSA